MERGHVRSPRLNRPDPRLVGGACGRSSLVSTASSKVGVGARIRWRAAVIDVIDGRSLRGRVIVVAARQATFRPPKRGARRQNERGRPETIQLPQIDIE